MFSRLIWGTRLSLAVGITAAALVIGLPLGILISNFIARMVLEEFVGVTPDFAVNWTVVALSAVGALLGARLVAARAARKVVKLPLAEALRASRGAIINMADIHAGRPTPEHPIYCAAKAGLVHAETVEEAPRLDTIPFESEHRFMATLHHNRAGRSAIYLKGSPEKVLSLCREEWRTDRPPDIGRCG